MRQLVLILSTLALAACGQGFKTANYSDKTSQGVPSPGATDNTNNTNNSTSIVDAPGATALGVQIIPVLLNLFKSFQDVTSIDYTKSSQVISSSQTMACPMGGSISASVSGTLALVVSFVNPTGSVNNGSGTFTFNNCMIQAGVALNGTANIVALMANLSAQLSATDNNTYTVTGAHNLVGNVNVSYMGASQSCTLALSDQLSSNGTFHILTKTATGSVSATLSGTVCGFNVNGTQTQTF